MILQELLGMLELQTLLEDLGNLRVIDKDLVRAFFNIDESYKERGLEKKIGKNSKVTKKLITSVTDMTELLRGPIETGKDYHNKTVKGYNDVGAVLVHDGDQIFSFCDNFFAGKTKEDFHSTSMFQVMATQKAIDLIPADVRKSKYIHLERNAHDKKVDIKDINSIETILHELLKAAGGKIEALVVSIDFDRLDQQNARAKMKAGMIPLPAKDTLTWKHQKAYAKYLTACKNDLVNRLESYKKNKAPNAATDKDLIAHIKDKGFPEFIKFMGFNYEKQQVHVNWRDLEEVASGKISSMHINNYITYTILYDSPGYRELGLRMYDLQQDLPEKDEVSEKAYEAIWSAYERKYHEVVPPEALEVIIALKGGMAMPAEVRLKRREFSRK
jgi:hypothetical protein